MNASQFVQLRRQRELGAANHVSAVAAVRQGHGQGHVEVGDAAAGMLHYYMKGRAFDLNLTPELRAALAAVPLPAAAQDWIGPALELLEDALNWIQAALIGPTVTARLLYIWAFTATAAWQALAPATAKGLLTGAHDGWDWDWRTAGGAAAMAGPASWLAATLAQAMTVFLPGYTPVSPAPVAASWMVRWQAWWAGRQADGSAVALATQPTVADASNVGLQIDVIGGGVPPTIRTDQWTPLNVLGRKQRYLTFFWGNVASTCLTGAQETAVKTTGSALAPAEAARAAEVAEVAALSANLTDRQKTTAELWAGGPGTVTPPGTLFWFWAEYCRQRRPSDRVFFQSGLDLAVHLFETSRITWALKARHVQARPIQEIRVRLGGTQLRTWNGTTIDAANWIPYQEDDFVTPPFADFPSGHSSYSAGFAHTMDTWFGRQTGGVVPRRRLDYIAPVVTAGQQVGSDPSFLVVAGSKIQPGVVPATPIRFSWKNWHDIAEEAGWSRLYGGIHCRSAHVGSKAVAEALHPLIETAWGFSPMAGT